MISARRLNAYYGPLHTAFQQLVLLNGIFFQFSTHSKQRATEIERGLGRRRGRVPWLAAASLVIEDVTDWPEDGWARCFPIGGHLRKGRRFLQALHEIVARQSASTVAEGFEVFEAYLRDISAVHLKRNPSALAEAAWLNRRRKSAGPAPKTRHISNHRTFVRAAYGGTNDLLKRLRSSIPEIAAGEHRNTKGMDLQSWLGVVTEVRHATVHGRGVLSPSQLKRLGPVRVSVLKRDFPGRIGSGGYRLGLDHKSGSAALEIFAEYALLIFKAVSQGEGLDYNVFRQVRIRV